MYTWNKPVKVLSACGDLFRRSAGAYFFGVNMENDLKQIYSSLSKNDKKALRAAVLEGDLITINSYKRMAAAAAGPALPDVKKTPEKRTVGRPDMGLTDKHKKEYYSELKQFRTLNNNNNNDVIESRPDDLEAFAAAYNNIIENCCNDFYINHVDLVKKTPVFWYNSLLYEIKKQLPKIDYKDVPRVAVAWEAFTALIYKIGLFPTMEAFTALTGIYKFNLEKLLTPEAIDLKQKIYNDCKDNMLAQVGYNPMTQVNKMFLLKSVYGLSEGSPAQVVQEDKKSRDFNDLPLFAITEKDENS